jgi:uncharacterized protein YciI
MSTITPLTVIKGTYLAPLDDVDAQRDAHLAWLRDLVADGRTILGGRRTPPDGSILVFRGGDADAVLATMENDPYVVAGVVSYELVGVFTPGTHAPQLAEFLAG